MPLTERQQMTLLLEMTAKEYQQQNSKQEKTTKTTEKSSAKKSQLKGDSNKINKRNKRGETQLHLAAIKGDIDGIKGLIKKGADVSITDYAGWTPLHEACNRGHYKIVRLLLKAGADVHAKGLEDDTPLHDAASNGHLKIVKILLKYGADPHRKNEDLENPIDVSSTDEITELLEEYGSLPKLEREAFAFSEDSSSDLSSNDDVSSLKSSEVENASKTSERYKSDRDNNDNDVNDDENDEDSLFVSRKRRKTSSRLAASQKRIISDEDDDEDSDDDDLELSRISEMVKRKRLAKAEKSKRKRVLISSHEEGKGDDPDKIAKSLSYDPEAVKRSSDTVDKTDSDMKKASTDKVTRAQKRKRKASQGGNEIESPVKRKAKHRDNVIIQKTHKKPSKNVRNEHEAFPNRRSGETTLREELSLENSESKSNAEPGEAALAQLGDGRISHENNPIDMEGLNCSDKNPYISDISDAEVDDDKDEKDEKSQSKMTSDMFRVNIFSNAFEQFSAQGPPEGANQSPTVKTEMTGINDKTDRKDSLPTDEISTDDAKENSVLRRSFAEDENVMPQKVSAVKLTQEEESQKTSTNDIKRNITKHGKKKIPKEKISDSVDIIKKSRKKKKSESSWEDCLLRETANKKTVLEAKQHKSSLDVLEESANKDFGKNKEPSLLSVVERVKDTERSNEKSGQLFDEGKLDTDTNSRRQDAVVKQAELDDKSSKLLKKQKKKKSNRCDPVVGEKSTKTVNDEANIDEVQSSNKGSYSDESSMDTGLIVSSKNEQAEYQKEECHKTFSSPTASKSKSVKEKSAIISSKHVSHNIGDEKKESLRKTLPTDNSKSVSDSLLALKKNEDSGISTDETMRSVADKEKIKESRKEKGIDGSVKEMSDSHKDHPKRGKLGSEITKKSKKEATGKAGVLSKNIDKVKEPDRDLKGSSSDGVKFSESVGKLREKVSKSQQENRNQAKGLKESKSDLKKDNDAQNKDPEKKGIKEHKKVISKDGKESKPTATREKDSKHIDGSVKISPVKEASDNKIAMKKEHRTPVKSKEVDLKIWDFGLPSPIKMQKLSKAKEHKKVHSKEGKLRKTSKTTESKDNLQKEKRVDTLEVLAAGSSEMKSKSAELLAPVSKKPVEEPTTLIKVADNDGNNLEQIENEENIDLSLCEDSVKDKDFAEEDLNISEKPVETKEQSSCQLEPLGKVAFEASDATSMDSPQTSQKTFETTSVNMDGTCNVGSASENLLEADTCSEKEIIESLGDDRSEKLEEVANEERSIIPLDENADDGDNDLKEKTKTEEDSKIEDHGSPLLLDKLSELGAGSDFEDHLGPFHGTKLEETDIDIRELSHPEDTLKMLTQEMSVHEASMQEDKLPSHEYQTVRMTGHDFTMLSEQINEKIQRLSSRSFVSELSEEEKQIVNISMEIAEDLSQEGDKHARHFTEADNGMMSRESTVIDGNNQKILSATVNEAHDQVNDSEQKIVHSKTQVIPHTSSISTTCVSMTETATENVVDSKISNVKEERPLPVDPGVIKTSPPVSHQDTDVARPLFARSRTVDLEPRGIAQVVADIDLNSISSCMLNREKPMDSTMSGVDTYGGEAMINELSNDSHTSKEIKFSEENSRDRLKKKATFVSSPTTWRKTLLTEYGYSKPDLPLQFRNFTVIKRDYHPAVNEIHNEDKEVRDPRMEELKQDHIIELKRLHLCMEQELIRVESRHRGTCGRKKAINVCSAIMYQKMEQYSNFSTNHSKKTQPNLSEDQLEELKRKSLQEVLDKFIKKEEEIIKRHQQEVSCLEHQISFEKTSNLGKEELLRKKYITAQRLSSMIFS